MAYGKESCAGQRSLKDSGDREKKINPAEGKRKCQETGSLHKFKISRRWNLESKTATQRQWSKSRSTLSGDWI